jgi:hypothetical protein
MDLRFPAFRQSGWVVIGTGSRISLRGTIFDHIFVIDFLMENLYFVRVTGKDRRGFVFHSEIGRYAIHPSRPGEI